MPLTVNVNVQVEGDVPLQALLWFTRDFLRLSCHDERGMPLLMVQIYRDKALELLLYRDRFITDILDTHGRFVSFVSLGNEKVRVLRDADGSSPAFSITITAVGWQQICLLLPMIELERRDL